MILPDWARPNIDWAVSKPDWDKVKVDWNGKNVDRFYLRPDINEKI